MVMAIGQSADFPKNYKFYSTTVHFYYALLGGRRPHGRRPKSPPAADLRFRSRVLAGPMADGKNALRRPLCAAALRRRSRVDAGPMVCAQKALRRSLCAAAPGWAPFP